MAQSKNDNSGSVGCGLCGVLQIIFIVMKLTAPESTIYKWSWIEVLIPLWISLGCCSCLCVCVSCGGCAYFTSTLLEEPKHEENNNNIKIVVKRHPKPKQYIIKNNDITASQFNINTIRKDVNDVNDVNYVNDVDEKIYKADNNV